MSETPSLLSILRDHAAKHTMAYLTAVALFASANLGAIYENFYDLPKAQMQSLGWWSVIALLCKSLNAGCIAVLGYLMKSPLPPIEKPPVP